ncbi:glycerophosphodiester phosphodiesterase [Planctobacterium marinum]|uniref:glycerophosphodiester phosphodiesterase n=1 Tax=Planctobacterium marinum TaxID=1631968 RepID=UPI001E3ED4AF|nr:glycerophosphodiester phosphodiesterase [Planctobacterium marinum]MCC2607797.1 glycerophosphodiester phosphodiesterase [Planctobacterium marinum]
MKIWAHRGASGEFPENTLMAFENAIVQQADGIELDVYQVEDEFYVWHDRVLPLFADTLLWQQSKVHMQQVQLPHGQKIPTLTEALNTIAARVNVNIELKTIQDTDALIRVIDEAVGEEMVPGSILISSFNHHYLADIGSRATRYELGVLTASSPLDMAFTCNALEAFSIHFDINCLRAEDVNLAHNLGLEVYVYTVDRLSELVWLRELKVDGVFTNYPQQARAFLQADRLPCAEY